MDQKLLDIHQQILTAKRDGQKLLAILLDPDKIIWENLDHLLLKINQSPAAYIFVGGSIVQATILEELIA